MSNQFKSGDLAIIVGANSLTQNIGKQCELREFVTSGDVYVAPNGEVYRHDDVRPGRWWVTDWLRWLRARLWTLASAFTSRDT